MEFIEIETQFDQLQEIVDSKKNISAYIRSISPLGVMKIEFNSSMLTDQINLTHINATVFDIYIDPALMRHKTEDSFKMNSINLTWSTLAFFDKQLDIQLLFNDPFAISPLIEQDQIVFHLKN